MARNDLKFIPLLIFVFFFSLYLLDSSYQGSTDTIPAQNLPISILKHKSLTFNHKKEILNDKHTWYTRKNENILSSYSPMPGLLNTPTFLVAEIFKVKIEKRKKFLSNITTCILAAFSVVFFYLTILNFSYPFKINMLLTGIHGLCTSVWSVASTSLWEHTASLFFLTLGLRFLFHKSKFSFLSGLFFGLAVCSRFNVIIFILPISIYYLLTASKRNKIYFILVSLFTVFLLLGYHYIYFNSPFAFLDTSSRNVDAFSGDFLKGLLGLLITPSRGLLFFTPFLIFIPFYSKTLFSNKFKIINSCILLSLIIYFAMMSKWKYWWGGYSYSYRIILDCIPFLLILFSQIILQIIANKKTKIILISMLCIAFYFQVIGSLMIPCQLGEDNLRNFYEENMWSLKRSQVYLCTKKFVKFY